MREGLPGLNHAPLLEIRDAGDQFGLRIPGVVAAQLGGEGREVGRRVHHGHRTDGLGEFWTRHRGRPAGLSSESATPMARRKLRRFFWMSSLNFRRSSNR